MMCYPDAVKDQESIEFCRGLGGRLRELRKATGLTQVQISGQLGISQQVYASYENGRLRLPVSLLAPLSGIYGAPVESILGIGKVGKRGPKAKLEHQLEAVRKLPRAKQKFVSEFLETVLQAS